jgi:nucleosome binding factor SPN SPT16 subunit
MLWVREFLCLWTCILRTHRVASMWHRTPARRYMQHCTNIARTLLIEATKEQEKNYDFLLKLYEAALAEMRPGKPIAGVYDAVTAMVRG